MPGAWELERPDVLVAILTRGMVPTAWAGSLRYLRLSPASKIIFLAGMPFDHARNSACAQMLQGGYKSLLFLDDDVMPPMDAVDRLKSHNLDIVSGLYYRRHIPVKPVAIRKTPNGHQYVEDFTAGQVVEVDMVGAGILLIHRRVLERIPKPWFTWLCDHEELPQPERISEDYQFCDLAKKHGFKIMLDTGVQCQHVGLGRAKFGGVFEPAAV